MTVLSGEEAKQIINYQSKSYAALMEEVKKEAEKETEKMTPEEEAGALAELENDQLNEK